MLRFAPFLGLSRALLAVTTSGLLLAAAVPPTHLGALAWIALVPLLVVTDRLSPARAALAGFLFGAVAFGCITVWVWQLPAFNLYDGLAFLSYLAMYPAVWCAAIAALRSRRLPWLMASAALWVALDWLRAHAGPLALPWEPLAHSQVTNIPLLQLARAGGAPALSFAVCLANVALAEALLGRRGRLFMGTIAAIAAVHLAGSFTAAETLDAGLRVAIIQPGRVESSPAAQLAILSQLSVDAAAQKPELIVWPESAVRSFARNAALQAALAGISRRAGAPILFGSVDYSKFGKGGERNAGATAVSNQAYLMLPDGTWQGPYTKNRLMPFGESMPFQAYFEWPSWLVTRWPQGIAGTAPGLFRLPGGQTIGVVICWENLFSDLADRLVAGGAQFVVQISNDSDFGVSGEPAQHNAAGVLRAVETGRTWIQVSTTGPSQVIDASGNILAISGMGGDSEWAIAVAPLESGNSDIPSHTLREILVAVCLVAAMSVAGWRYSGRVCFVSTARSDPSSQTSPFNFQEGLGSNFQGDSNEL